MKLLFVVLTYVIVENIQQAETVYSPIELINMALTFIL